MLLPNLTPNEQKTLAALHKYDVLTRHDLAPRLNVSKMQVTNVVKSLLEKKLIVERAVNKGERGQPIRSLTLNANECYAIGVSFTGSHLDIALVNWKGELINKHTENIAGASIDRIAQLINDFINKVSQGKQIRKNKIAGVGISAPGDFVEDNKKLNAIHFPQFQDVDLHKAFSEKLDYNIYIENDSNCFAWGEALVGIAKSVKNCIFLHLGHGIGGGIIINNKLYRGANGNAGVFGTPFPDINQPRPSGSDLIKYFTGETKQTIGFRDLNEVSVNHPAIEAWLTWAAKELVTPLTVITRAFDPELLVIGGRLPISYTALLAEKIQAADFCQHDRDRLPTAEIAPARLGSDGGVIGAASLCFEHIFHTL